MFCTTNSPEPGGCIYFGDTGDIVGRSRHSADGRALAVYVTNPHLGVFDQLLRLSPTLIQGHGKVNLKSEFRRQNRSLSLRPREEKLTESSPNSLQS